MNTNLKREIEFLIKPLSILLIIVLLFITVLVFGLKQINTVRTKIDSIKVTEETLNKKIGTLETVAQVLSGNITFLDIVLPSKGAVLYGLSQVKTQALLNNLTISGLKTGSQVAEKEGVFKTSISFDVEGDEISLYNFLNSFFKLLPLMNVEKVSLTKLDNLMSASVTISVFSSQLPTKIPALTEAVKELTNEEIKLLRELASYGLPQFVEPSANSGENIKTDPFN